MKFYQLTNKSFTELGVKTHKDLWKKVKKDHRGLSATVHTEFKKADDSDNKFDVIMSTATEDRHGDIVEQNWDLKNFKKNPVFLDSHNYDSIEHIIGKVNKIAVNDGKLKGQIEFMLDNPKGMLAYKMARDGFLNATSVGFIPKEFDDKGSIIKSELLEDSAVSVPAQADALFEKAEKKYKKKKVEKKEIKKVEIKKLSRVEALKRIAKKKEERRKEIYKEVLAVTQRLAKGEVDIDKRRQMANRIIRQMIKVK